MTENEINEIQVNDVLMNIRTSDIIVIKGIEDICFRCIWGDSRGEGSIPKVRLENPSWYSLMKEKKSKRKSEKK